MKEGGQGQQANAQPGDALTGSAGMVIAQAAAGGAAGGVAGAVTAQVTARVLNRRTSKEAPKIELPPGVKRK